MKVRIRKNGPVTEQPDVAAKKLIEAGLWFAADEKKADTKPVTDELPKTRKSR